MESEKIKEIKKALECCSDRVCEVCSRLKSEPNQEEDCRLALMKQSLTLINELESENNDYHEINIVLRRENEQLKTLASSLEKKKEDLLCKEYGFIKYEKEVVFKYLSKLAERFFDLGNVVNKEDRDETLKEFINESI